MKRLAYKVAYTQERVLDEVPSLRAPGLYFWCLKYNQGKDKTLLTSANISANISAATHSANSGKTKGGKMPTVYLRKELYDALIKAKQEVNQFVNKVVEDALKAQEPAKEKDEGQLTTSGNPG